MLVETNIESQHSMNEASSKKQSLDPSDKSNFRFTSGQKNRTLIHPLLPQPNAHEEQLHLDSLNLNNESLKYDFNVPKSEMTRYADSYSFVVCADTQLGMTNMNRDWDIELNNARRAVKLINSLENKPSFCVCCGDLVDMEHTFYQKPDSQFTKEECDKIQDQQNLDFKSVWSELDDSIALVCICGNHDVGNRPTRDSINRFRSAYGDEFLAFWSNGCYNIILNNVLFVDPSGAVDMFYDQLEWLEDRLQYANDHNADQIFVFAHHPWFLYNDDEENEDLLGMVPYPSEWASESTSTGGFPEAYFSMNRKYRDIALNLFKQYGVKASFSGHFHQNVISKSSFGMNMIITGPLSIVFDSTGKPKQSEENKMGVRVVNVMKDSFTHHFVPLEEQKFCTVIETEENVVVAPSLLLKKQ